MTRHPLIVSVYVGCVDGDCALLTSDETMEDSFSDFYLAEFSDSVLAAAVCGYVKLAVIRPVLW